MLQGITFRLDDAVPLAVIAAWKQELNWIEKRADAEEEVWEQQRQEMTRRLAVYEDAGHGACHLRHPEIALMVEGALGHFDGQRYDLTAWCIMPNHAHVLIRTKEGWPVGHVVQSWKRHSGRYANRFLHTSGTPFWAADYHDRFIRDEAHYWRALHYIHENPVKAGLCGTAVDWKWSSAAAWTAKVNFAGAEEAREGGLDGGGAVGG